MCLRASFHDLGCCGRVAAAAILGLALAGPGAAATPDATTAPEVSGRPNGQPPTTDVPAAETADAADRPGLTIDREAGFVELDATVIGHGCEWLELVACTPGSREHEALVTIDAKPSDLHLALLLLGLEAGKPQTGVRGEDGWIILPPTGPVVDLHFVLPAADDAPAQAETVAPVESWVFDRAADAVLPDTPGGWIFTGSRLVRDRRDPESPEVYLADVNGTAVSLVHFGDETIGRDTAVTESDDGQNLAPHAEAMPPNGTKIRLRISRMAPDDPHAKAPPAP
ncbi:MAG: YdjY domain-containing protein [Planctomycetota bacterium]